MLIIYMIFGWLALFLIYVGCEGVESIFSLPWWSGEALAAALFVWLIWEMEG